MLNCTVHVMYINSLIWLDDHLNSLLFENILNAKKLICNGLVFFTFDRSNRNKYSEE